MLHELPLEYSFSALEPYLSKRALELHYELYCRYVRRTNELTRSSCSSTKEAVSHALGVRDAELYEQAAQAWIHELYFASMAPPNRSRRPPTVQTAALERDWSGASSSVFGSGWVWLLAGRNGFSIKGTQDADIPVGAVLLVMDVWEHAYFLDYEIDRAKYAQDWLRNLANWDSALRRVGAHRHLF